ncbi:MAG: phosphate uptake regulator PhoU [Candidatus Thermoplasmatota archaeon]|nr:phosphate uptake regulator PhoU [Candidatus Thermoplasmatota archaeon]
METRKVQVSGGSTFIVSLPKKWAEKNSLSSGTPLNIMEDRNGLLVLSPQPVGFRESVVGELKLAGDEKEDAIIRRLVGAYISGVTSIEVSSKPAILTEHARAVREFTRLVMGVEIVEEKKDLIRLQDLIDPADFSVRTGLKRMSYLTEKMIEDSLKALSTPDRSVLEDVVHRDMEVDRINWLIHKEFNMVSLSPKVADRTKMSPEDALNFMLSARAVERVADHAVSMAGNIMEMEDFSERSISDSVVQAGMRAKEIFSDSVISVFSKDLALADSVIDRSREIRTHLNPIFKKILKLPADEAVHLGYMINSIERIAAYGGDIAKITLNTFTPKK